MHGATHFTEIRTWNLKLGSCYRCWGMGWGVNCYQDLGKMQFQQISRGVGIIYLKEIFIFFWSDPKENLCKTLLNLSYYYNGSMKIWEAQNKDGREERGPGTGPWQRLQWEWLVLWFLRLTLTAWESWTIRPKSLPSNLKTQNNKKTKLVIRSEEINVVCVLVIS